MEARDRRESTRYELVWETDGVEADARTLSANYRQPFHHAKKPCLRIFHS